MGQYDIFVYGGLAAAAGYYLFVMNPDFINTLFPPVNGGTTTEPDPGAGDDNEKGSGGYDCKKACNSCWCKSYNEKCKGSCSNCRGGSTIPSKCSGKTAESGGKFETGGSSNSKSEDCRNYCNKGWCESYRKRGCTGGCMACSGISGRTCPEKVYNSNCAGDCKSTCWRSKVSTSNGYKIVQVCVGKSGASACTAARSAFCKKYGPCKSSNLASLAYQAYEAGNSYQDMDNFSRISTF